MAAVAVVAGAEAVTERDPAIVILTKRIAAYMLRSMDYKLISF
jgi:hypothetical protein